MAEVSLGALNPWSTWGEFNKTAFVIQQALSKMQTSTVVRVEACTNSGGVSHFGFVDVTPLVNQVDGSGNPTPHVTVYSLPYMRLQGGTSAIILDPQPGDLGIAVFASRDISKIKSTQGQANPGSFRTFDFADGMYLGGLLNATPQQYVQFSSNGITIVAPNTITLSAPNIVLQGALAQTGGDVTLSQKLTAVGDIVGAGISMQSHTHTSEAAGTPTSEPIP